MNNFYSKKVLQHFRNPKNMGVMKNPDGMAVVGNPVCLPPTELININSSIQLIERLKPGVKTMGIDGKYHHIKKVFKKKYVGTLLNINIHNLGKTILTPDHQVFAIKLSEYPHKYVKFNKLINKKIFPNWYHADELKKGDFVLYPVLQNDNDRDFMEFDIEIPKWDFKSKLLPRKIRVNNDFLRLIGYFLAEGSTITKKCKGSLTFTFGSHEKEFIKDVEELMMRIFNLRVTLLRNHQNSTNITYYSARLARFFSKYFGKGAINKQLPFWIIDLPVLKQEALISGLWRGDGYISKKKKVAKFVTISKILAYQLKQLLLRQKIIFSFLESPPKGIHKRHYSIYIKEDKSLKKIAYIVGNKISFDKNIINPQKTWFYHHYYLAPVWKIQKENYEGDVYNLEVDGGHTFVTNSLILHNCGDVMKMYLRIKSKIKNQKSKIKTEYIKDVKFQTLGCAAAIATSSIITQMIKGKTLNQALTITNKAVAKALGGLPIAKMHCSVLAAQAVKKAIGNYQEKKVD